MPMRRVSGLQSFAEGSSQGVSHSPVRSSQMGNRQLASKAPALGSKQTPSGKLMKRSLSSSKQTGDKNFQRKASSGSTSTVGEMIPFQRGSRREPHVQAVNPDRDKNVPNKRTVQSVNAGDENSSSLPSSSRNVKGEPHETSSTSNPDGLQPNTSPPPKLALSDGRPSVSRSVRPKQKKMLPQPSPQSFEPRNANGASTTVSRPKPGEVEVVRVSNTNPRRRIVKRKSQAATGENNRQRNEIAPSSRGTQQTRTAVDDPATSLQLDNETSVQQEVNATLIHGDVTETCRDESLSISSHPQRNSVETVRPLSRSTLQTVHRSMPESESVTERVNFSRHSDIEQVAQSLPANGSELPTELLPRRLSSARVPAVRSLSRNENIRSGLSSGRPSFRPAIATAAELGGTSSASPDEVPETYPNSVRRSFGRSQHDSASSSMVDRPRLGRQSSIGTIPQARQRELIDVNTAASVLSRRVPPAAAAGNELAHGNSVSRPESSTVRGEEDVWLPQSRPQRRNREASNVGEPRENLPLNTSLPGTTASPATPSTRDVTFRDSPVTNLQLRRRSRLSSSDGDNLPSAPSATRPTAAIPSRRGLYRALSVLEDADPSSSLTSTARTVTTTNSPRERLYGTSTARTATTPNSPRERLTGRYDNMDSEDMDRWRHIESEHSNLPTEPRQRLIYQDRARGRTSILNRGSSAQRITPSSADSVPDIHDPIEFPSLESSQHIAFRNRSTGVRRDSSEQESSASDTGQDYEMTQRNRQSETPPPTPTPGRRTREEGLSETSDNMMEHLVLLASPIFGPLMLQASPAVLFNMLSRARRDFGGEFVELLIENVVLSLLAQHTFDVTGAQTMNNGGAPPPASQETIDTLEKVVVTEKMVVEDASCAICHCDYEIEEVLDRLPCKHIFHNQCITIWLKKSGTCPVCRHKMYVD
ncbi:uncharacterized protein [Diadema setosum]|uniref:uncharacterized protein n=1 Tax=Diadema setosum TaxID=31175 RepID=UPI003B39FA63